MLQTPRIFILRILTRHIKSINFQIIVHFAIGLLTLPEGPLNAKGPDVLHPPIYATRLFSFVTFLLINIIDNIIIINFYVHLCDACFLLMI